MSRFILSFFLSLCLLPSNGHAGNLINAPDDLIWISAKERRPSVLRQVKNGKIGLVFERTMDDQVLARTQFVGDAKLFRLKDTLANQTQVEIGRGVEVLFSFDGRAFGILDDLRLIEFKVPAPVLTRGNWSKSFWTFVGGAGYGAVMTTCALVNQSYPAAFLAAGVSILASHLAYEAQQGCDLQVEILEFRSEDRPFYVRELFTQSLERPSQQDPPVVEALVEREGEAPRLLSDVLYHPDTCETLLTRQSVPKS